MVDMARGRHAIRRGGIGLGLELLSAMVVLGWLGLGFWLSIDGDGVSPVLLVGMSAGGLAASGLWLRDFVPKQDFTRQPWRDRGREVGNLFRWKTMAGREWGVWLIALCYGLPLGIWGLVTGPPGSDRLGSLVLVAICAPVSWVGVKFLDARIARRRRESPPLE